MSEQEDTPETGSEPDRWVESLRAILKDHRLTLDDVRVVQGSPGPKHHRLVVCAVCSKAIGKAEGECSGCARTTAEEAARELARKVKALKVIERRAYYEELEHGYNTHASLSEHPATIWTITDVQKAPRCGDECPGCGECESPDTIQQLILRSSLPSILISGLIGAAQRQKLRIDAGGERPDTWDPEVKGPVLTIDVFCESRHSSMDDPVLRVVARERGEFPCTVVHELDQDDYGHVSSVVLPEGL